MITGQTLFSNNTEDNLNNRDLRRLCQWNDDDLHDALDNVHNRRGKHQPLGRDLLQQLLQPEASNRPKSFKRVLDHPFFVGESTEELEKEKENLQVQLKHAQERGDTAESMQRLEAEIAKSSGVISELKATTKKAFSTAWQNWHCV